MTVEFKHGTAAKVYFVEKDISPYLESVSLTLEREIAETRVLDSTAVGRVPGLKAATLELEGVYDPTSYEAAIWAAIDSADEGIAVVLLGGAAFGDYGYMAEVLASSEQINAGNDAIRMPCQAFALDLVRRGVVLHALAEETASDEGDALDQSASSADGGAAYFICTALDTGVGLTAKVQDSSDGINWTDLATFAASAPASDIVEVSGAVERYVRAIWTLSGVGGATFFAGWARD